MHQWDNEMMEIMAHKVLEIRQRIMAKVEHMRSLQPQANEQIVSNRTR